MLTTEAMQERKWGQYPALRTVLEDKELPAKYYRTSSISYNVFKKINRLLEISFLVQEKKHEIEQNQDSLINQDLELLSKELINMNDFINVRICIINELKY